MILRMIQYTAMCIICISALYIHGDSELLTAIYSNDADAVQNRLETGNVNIHIHSEHGSTPLHEAVRMWNDRIVQLLIHYNADINKQDADGKTALWISSEQKSFSITHMLLTYKADPTIPDAHQQDTPLHRAIYNYDISAAKLLLQHGASPNASNKYLKTPLHIAAQHNHQELVRMLLIYGANPEIEDYKNKMPGTITNDEGVMSLLTRAMIIRSMDEVESIPEEWYMARTEEEAEQILTNIQMAMGFSQHEIAENMIDEYKNPSSHPDSDDETAIYARIARILMHAHTIRVVRNDTAMERIIDTIASVNSDEEDELTPEMLAKAHNIRIATLQKLASDEAAKQWIALPVFDAIYERYCDDEQDELLQVQFTTLPQPYKLLRDLRKHLRRVKHLVNALLYDFRQEQRDLACTIIERLKARQATPIEVEIAYGRCFHNMCAYVDRNGDTILHGLAYSPLFTTSNKLNFVIHRMRMVYLEPPYTAPVMEIINGYLKNVKGETPLQIAYRISNYDFERLAKETPGHHTHTSP